MGKMIKQTAVQTYEILAKQRKMYEHSPTPLLKTTIENLERKAKSLMDSEMLAGEKNFLDKHAGSDWWELAKKQYPITQDNLGYTVTSEAANWQEEKSWQFAYKFEAMQKVEQLVDWMNDHRNRGHGNRDADLERLTAKYA